MIAPGLLDSLLEELVAVSCSCEHPGHHDLEPLGTTPRGPWFRLGRCGLCPCPGGRLGRPIVLSSAERRRVALDAMLVVA